MQSGKSGAKPKGSKKKTQDKPKTEPKTAGRAPPGFAAAPAPPSGFSDEHQRLLRHRALFAFRFLVGKAVDVQLADGVRFAGVLDCIDPDDFSLVLKSAKRLSESAEPFESGSTVIFKRQQIAHLAVDGVVNYTDSALPAAATSGFRTDTEISGKKTEHLFGRELEVASSWLDPSLDAGGLEEPRRRSSKNNWNQFEANQKLFGVVSGFDENLYTTKLDKTRLSAAQSREAERIAQEIERQATNNFHLQEERGQRVQDDGLDEEARYSSVDRTKGGVPPSARGPNSYIPPALRNAQRQTSGGAKAKGDKAASVPSPPPSSTVTPTTSSTPAPKTAPSVTPAAAPAKPLSFSDAVKGRSSAPATNPAPPAQPSSSAPDSASSEQEVAVEPKKTDAAPPKANGKEAAKETKKAKSSDKKITDAKQSAVQKERKDDATKAKASETKATEPKTESKVEAKSEEAPKKKGLNPNAKEFKLSASAAEFTPKFAQPAVYPAAGMYPPPQQYQVPYHQMGMPPYGPGPEEWGYDAMGVPMEEGAEMMGAPYGYGVPMAPNGMMPMYPPMMPPQQNARMGSGNHRGHSQQGYHQRGYYNGGYGGGYHGNGRAPGGPAPQPPLPREPSPSASDEADASAPTEVADTSKSQPAASPTKKASKK